jgi:hypothetical protein
VYLLQSYLPTAVLPIQNVVMFKSISFRYAFSVLFFGPTCFRMPYVSGLPDGFKPKSRIGYFWGLGMDNFGIFYGQLEHFTTIWYTLKPFSICCGRLVYFLPFWYIVPRNIWQPCHVCARTDGHGPTVEAYSFRTSAVHSRRRSLPTWCDPLA